MERVLLQENIWQKVRECQFNKFRQYTDNRNCLVVIINYDINNFQTHFFTIAMVPEKNVVGGNFQIIIILLL